MLIKQSTFAYTINFFKSKHKTKVTNLDYLTWGPNVGVMLVKNTKWSLNFFKKSLE